MTSGTPLEGTVSLVNNAGVMLLGPIQDAPLEEWEQMLAVNVAGLLYFAHAALLALLAAADDGPRHVADMVNISSVAGRIARLGGGAYNLTKFGIGAFSESLRHIADAVSYIVTGPVTWRSMSCCSARPSSSAS